MADWSGEGIHGLPTSGGTLTGQLTLAAGSEAAPPLAVTGEPDTGIWSPGSNRLGIVNGGTLYADFDVGSLGFGNSSNANNYLVYRTGTTGTVTVAGSASNGTRLVLYGSAHTDAGKLGLTVSSQTTVGAAGGASALPATPVGYMVFKINGTDRAVPYYVVS
jgi:hypothetical protein